MADEKTQVNVSADIPPPKKEDGEKKDGQVTIHPNAIDTGAGDKKEDGVKVEVTPGGSPPPPKPEVKVEVKPEEQGEQKTGTQVQVQPGDSKPEVKVEVPPSRAPAPGLGEHDTKTF